MLVLVVGGAWYYLAQKKTLQGRAEADLRNIAQLKLDQIVQWRAERLADAQLLTDSPLFAEAVARLVADRHAAVAEEILASLRSLQTHSRYSDILVFDAAGQFLVSLSGSSNPLTPEATQVLTASLGTGKAMLTDLHVDPGDPSIHFSAVAPLFVERAGASVPVGGIVLKVNAAEFLFPLVQSWPTLTRTAETLLVRRDGNDVLYLNELRYQHDTALKLRFPLSQKELPAAMAVLGRTGIVYGKDYRGVRVMAMLAAIPDSPWFMVAKEEESEVFAGWRMRSALIVALIVMIAAACAAGLLMVWQRDEKSRYRTLLKAEAAQRESQERLRITLMSVGDGVISTDAQGAVQLMNPTAEALAGWSQQEARGKPLDEVFRIVNEQTRKPVENSVQRVTREGLVVGLAKHTLLISRTGREHSIADSGAPIRDEQGRVVGIVLVFRDITAENRYVSEREATVNLLSFLNEQNMTHELVRGVTALLQNWSRCAAVGVRLKEGDDFPYFETRGFPPEFVAAESSLCETDPHGNAIRDSTGSPVLDCMCGNVIRGRFDPRLPFFTAKGSFWTNSTTRLLASTTEGERQSRTRNRCNGEGYESVALIPLRAGTETLGLLQFNDRAEGRFTPELLAFLEGAADRIAITLAQRQTKRALAESEEHYRFLFENMLNGFAFCRMIHDQGRPHDFIYLEVNSAFESLTGLKGVKGRKVSEVIPGIQASDPGLLEIYGRVASTGVPERFETFVEAMKMWFSISVYSSRKDHFVTVFDVISERKRAEAERLMLASAIDQAGEMIVVTDASGAIQYMNPAFETVTGYPRAEVIGRNPSFLKSGAQDADFYRALWETISGGKTWKGRIVNRKKNGTLYTEDAIISPVRDASGTIVNYVAAKHDCTHELQLEAQLLQAQKMESVGRLAGGVAHDFNNMLQVIIGYVELSLDHVEPDKQLYRNLQEIGTAARRSADLTGQLLAFARKQRVNPQVLVLDDVIGETLNMLRPLIGEDIDLAWKPGIAGGMVSIDPTQLNQILANLAVNARDAIAGNGKLTIETGEAVFDEAYCANHLGYVPGEYLLMAVSDNGHGMDKATMSHLFEPFFTTKDVGLGTGLGLATVYGIVRQNNGFINVYSEPGEGTSFKIYLPRNREASAATRTESVKVVQMRGAETILVVEDEEAILGLCRAMLEGLGYTVLTGKTPEEAIRGAEEGSGPIHLLITDVVMPQMNGRDLASRLRTILPGLKCLFMSGYTANVIAHQGVLEEGVAFIAKPFSFEELAKRVRATLDG